MSPHQDQQQGASPSPTITADRWGHAHLSSGPANSFGSDKIEPEQGSNDSEEEINKPVENPEEKQNPAPEVGAGE